MALIRAHIILQSLCYVACLTKQWSERSNHSTSLHFFLAAHAAHRPPLVSKESELSSMSRSFGLVDSKTQEAEYFLSRILESNNSFFGVQCDTVAFTASARSVTFAMQSSLKGIQEFDKWYETKQEQMRADSLSKFFNNFRRISQHIEYNAVVGGSMKNGEFTYHFGELPELKNVPEIDVATACKAYFISVLELVYECYITFPTLINGQWRFTREHFQSEGLTIEDAEEEVDLPRGYSDVPDLDENIRWKCLRKQVDGCNLQHVFEEWLGKRVPHPDDYV